MEETIDRADTAGELNALFSCLESSERRHLLGHLRVHAPAAVTRAELATAIAASSQRKAPAGVTEEEHQQALAALHHVHLPKLDSTGLITENADGISLADHPAYRDAGILAAVDDRATAGTSSLDSLFGSLAETRRRTVLDALSHEYHPVHVQTLARDIATTRLAGDRRGGPEGDVEGPEEGVERPDEDVERVLRTLVHVHLPKLKQAGLIEYDTDEGTVTYGGHPLLRVPWMHSQLGPGFRESLADTPADAEIRTIEGREKIVSCGQSLCEEADEELFLMFTTTGLLEAGCFTRIEQAADRGVNVFLGTADPDVRAFVRERAPEVTLWRPQTSWLHLPVEDKNVGRVVFADREAIMIGTLGERSDSGVHRERAIFGEGADNTLVVLLRQMTDSRLGDQVEDVEAKLPF